MTTTLASRIKCLFLMLLFCAVSSSSPFSDHGGGGKQHCYHFTYWDESSQNREYCVALCVPGGGQRSECDHLCQEYLQCIEEANKQLKSVVKSSKSDGEKYTNSKVDHNEENKRNLEDATSGFKLTISVISAIAGLFGVTSIVLLLFIGISKKPCRCAHNSPSVPTGGVPPEGDISTEPQVTTPLSRVEYECECEPLTTCVPKDSVPPEGDTYTESQVNTPLSRVEEEDATLTKIKCHTASASSVV